MNTSQKDQLPQRKVASQRGAAVNPVNGSVFAANRSRLNGALTAGGTRGVRPPRTS